MGNIHHLSSLIKIKKSFKWLNPRSSQSCLTLISLQVFIAFQIILRKILSRKFVFNDPYLYFNIQVNNLVDTSFYRSLCFWSSCLADILSLDNFYFFSRLLLFFFDLMTCAVQMYTKSCPFFLLKMYMIL